MEERRGEERRGGVKREGLGRGEETGEDTEGLVRETWVSTRWGNAGEAVERVRSSQGTRRGYMRATEN